MPKLTEEQQLEWAVSGWESYDQMVGPGGAAEHLPASEKLRLETNTLRSYGPRPEFLTPEEILANQRAAGPDEPAENDRALQATCGHL